MISWIWCFRDSAPPLLSCSSYRMPQACLEMLWEHIQPFNPHLAHTMTKVECHGGQLFRVCDRHRTADGAALRRRDDHVYLARRQQHLGAQARTPAPERLSRSIAIPIRAT